MAIGLIGKKIGMTRVFDPSGISLPVTVLHVDNNYITQLIDSGYKAIQVSAGKQKASRVNKAILGQYAKAGVEPGRGLWEFRLEDNDSLENYEMGKELTVEMLAEGQMVDAKGISIGKGYAGVIKRWNFTMQCASHGVSLAHRAPGSIGQNQSPGRVFKNKKMAGRMGNRNRTVQNLQIVQIDVERNLLLIKGAVPGSKGSYVVVLPAVKLKNKEQAA